MEMRGVRGEAPTRSDRAVSGYLKQASAAPVQQQSLDTGPLMWFRAWGFAEEGGSQGNPGWKGPQEVSSPTSCSKQGQL